MLKKCIGVFALVIFTITPFLNVNAQTKEEITLLKEAHKSLAHGEYFSAKKTYQKLLALNPNDAEYQLETGLAYYNSEKDRELAIPYFEKANELYGADTLADVYYYLGQSHHFIEEFEKAIEYYITYQSIVERSDELARNVTPLIEMCNNGIHLIELKNKGVTIENIGGSINSQYPEYAPIISRNFKKLVYTSRQAESTGGNFYNDNKYYEDIYLSENIDGEWMKGERIGKGTPNNESLKLGVNTKWHDAAIGLNYDENKLFIYRKNSVWVSEKNENGKWGNPVVLNNNINVGSHIPSVYINRQETKLFVVSDRKDGFGGMDIYVSDKMDSGDWGEAKNLGASINTPFDEEAPFLNKEENILFFSSKGHNTMGGYDVYYAVLEENGTWSKAINAGVPINSPADDIYYIQNEDSTVAYYSSNRAYGLGDMDIYEIQLTCKNIPHVEVRGLVVDGNTLDGVNGGKVIAYNAETNQLVGEYPINEEGKYMMILPPGKEYHLELHPDKIILDDIHKTTVAVPNQCEYYQIYQVIEITTEDEQQVALFKNLFFDVAALADENYSTQEKQEGERVDVITKIMHNDVLPAKGIEVHLVNGKDEIVAVSHTNDAGLVRFNQLLVDGNYSMMISENDIKVGYYGLQEANTDNSIVVKGKVEKIITDSLNRKNERPYVNMEIQLVDNNKQILNYSTTDREGRFILDNLADESLATRERDLTYNLDMTDQDRALTDLAHSMYVRDRTGDIKNFTEATDSITIDLDDIIVPAIAFENILFDFDKYFLRDKSKETLDKIYNFLANTPEATIKVAGHTDWMGTDEYNVVLSKNRTFSAYDYLVEKGIAAGRITKMWFGESQPTANNALQNGSDDPVGRQLNRRCEFEITIPSETAELIITF